MKSYCVYEIETTNEKERKTILEIFKEYSNLEEVEHLRDECSPDVFCLKFEIDGNGQTYESFFDDVDNAIVKLDYAAFEIERYVPYDFYVYSISDKDGEETARGRDCRRRRFSNGKSYQMASINKLSPSGIVSTMFKKRINKIKVVINHYFKIEEIQNA